MLPQMSPRYLINFDLSKIKKVYTDFLIVGSGIAGLYTSLKLSPWEIKIHPNYTWKIL